MSILEPQTWQLGSLSHYIKLRAAGYEDLPPFPDNPPPGDCRNVEPIIEEEHIKSYKQDKKNKDMFSWESEQSSVANSLSGTSSDSSESESDSSEEESSNEESSDEQSDK